MKPGRQLWTVTSPYAGTLSVDNTGLYLTDYAPAYQGAKLRKYSRAGIEGWVVTLDRNQVGSFTANSDGIYMTNLAHSSSEQRVQRYIRSFGADGNLEWTRILPGELDEFSSVIVADEG